MKFRDDIQGLRACAVLFVFIFHISNTYLPGGFVGVDMFFVISGFLITKIVQSKIEKQQFNLWDFYVGRIKRIIPAYYFLLLVVWVIFLFVYASIEAPLYKKTQFWAFLFNSNNYFANLDTYFGAKSNEIPLLHTWTLSVEMQFYFILPIVLLLIKNKKWLISVLAVATVMLFGYATYEISIGNKGLMYFSLLSRSPEFFIGAIAALLHLDSKAFTMRYGTLLSTVGIVALLVSAFLLNESSPFPGALAIVPCLATLLILISPNSPINRALANPKLAFLGEISYSVYLWHWPIIAFIRYANFRYELSSMEVLLVIFLTAVGSLFSYYCIERPLRKQEGWKFYMPFVSMVVLNVLMVYFTFPIKNRLSNTPEEFAKVTFGLDSHSDTFKEVGILGDTSYQGKNILLLGDSHGSTMKAYMDAVGKKYHLKFRTITNDTYVSIPNLTANDIPEKSLFDRYLNLQPHIIKEVENADVIVVVMFKSGDFLAQPILEFLKSLRSDQRVVFMADYPYLNLNPARLNKGIVKDSAKNIVYKMGIEKLDSRIQAKIDSMPNAMYIDVTAFGNFFKDAPFYQDTLMYYDNSHLNRYGAEHYADVTGEEFYKKFKWAIE